MGLLLRRECALITLDSLELSGGRAWRTEGKGGAVQAKFFCASRAQVKSRLLGTLYRVPRADQSEMRVSVCCENRLKSFQSLTSNVGTGVRFFA